MVSLCFFRSSGHLKSQQKCEDPEIERIDAQQSMLVTSLTPLQLSGSYCDNVSTWLNPTPGSYRYYRPVRIVFERETTETINAEFNRLKNQMKRLKKYESKLSNGKDVSVTFRVHSTKSLNLGLALLHAEIKACEHLLHLAYKAPIGSKTLKWNVTKDVRDDVGAHEKVIQDNVRSDIGVRPDLVSQRLGTTNTDNLARRCFQDSKKFAPILGLDEDFVQNLADIMILFKSRRKINYDLSDQYCWEVYWQHYELCPWTHLNVGLHKLLMHGCRVARDLSNPVYYFSEDNQAAW
ncbi:hypothetical protein QAD02_007108 [Eretmocerus hayati]|uniref:Uncharacterized protein n=1 Tax=Eretmocerus hayati TaxID=131215 RepID=A0ACC2N3J6_9HYME|nr:hypothetical protein QAD02_007108 [Eretmocerus hayati]